MTQIRKAAAGDVDILFELGKTVSQFSVNEKTVNFWPKDILASAIASDNVLILVAEVDQQVVGFVIANLNMGLRKAIIENIYVRPENRAANIGSELLDGLLASLGDAAIEYVATLIPLDAESAAGLYVKAGFSKGEAFLWLDKSMSPAFER